MVVDVESRAASVTEGKIAVRTCDACTRRSRASWYCPADDAFLCQSCDTSIHSANHLTKRHERIRLQSLLTSPELKKTTSVWYEGFRRKTRTPRNQGLSFEKSLQITSEDPLVPELGGEEEEDDEFYSLSSRDENEENLNCCVPVFYPFASDMVIDYDINSFGVVPNGVNNGEELEELEREVMNDEGLIGFLPLDMDLGELTIDVESLLEEEQSCLGVNEPNSIGLTKEEINIGFGNCKELKRVKDEEEEEEEEEAMCENDGPRETDREASKDVDRKTSLSLRLDYEAVISAWDNHGSPWKTGIKPEFNIFDCCRDCLLGGSTCSSHVISGLEELSWTVGSVTHRQERDGGGSDGKREARVLRYKEKRRTRLFSKKIRYEVRKLNAEQRPRFKGRFVKRTSLFA